MPEPTENPTATEQLAALREITANLQAHIEARAAVLAAKRTAPLEAEIAHLQAAREHDAAAAEARRQGVVAELRRHLVGVARDRAKANWMNGYLPEPLRPRSFGFSSGNPEDQPSETFMADADERARAAGLDPDAHPGQEARARARQRAARAA